MIYLIQYLFRWLTRVDGRLEQLTERVNAMSADQSHLDADVAALGSGLDSVEQEIAALKAQPAGTPLDFTALDAAVARVKGDEPAPAPVDQPPADNPPAA